MSDPAKGKDKLSPDLKTAIASLDDWQEEALWAFVADTGLPARQVLDLLQRCYFNSIAAYVSLDESGGRAPRARVDSRDCSPSPPQATAPVPNPLLIDMPNPAKRPNMMTLAEFVGLEPPLDASSADCTPRASALASPSLHGSGKVRAASRAPVPEIVVTPDFTSSSDTSGLPSERPTMVLPKQSPILATAAASTATDTTSTHTESNAGEMILQPLSPDSFSTPKERESLFLPPSARRLCFKEEVTKFWNAEVVRTAFDEVEIYPIDPPRAAGEPLLGASQGPERLVSYFQREVIEVVDEVCNELLCTAVLRESEFPEYVNLRQAAEKNVDDDESIFNPTYIVETGSAHENNETRLIGHAEFVGGRPSALTWAIQHSKSNAWGSLRCVVGDIASHMLMGGMRFAFLTTCDEVIFLRMDIEARLRKRSKGKLDYRWSHPVLLYSDPIKHTDVLNEAEKTVPVRLALLALMYGSMDDEDGWRLPDETVLGKSTEYFARTVVGARWLPTF
ncbi:hypothetical protein P153DRAFT_386860 [Dothidotthia symphoricarpi CBS 119687]|uniref:Uncharacterized protein n=1 Tax=Dothidotthia symphoricarpi CBS 119687 TaxID=1392245 RepID=A0A6A6A9X9_9PLEO|nr:uncharacterized protein P153DRAFT_386860 [Dothidotthia symphoricarpi CBS 119687]KAF2127884.1 hypothetical protein P153DRAFT_386860 [Dothidotthia symphoricarpi CBS 119687]